MEADLSCYGSYNLKVPGCACVFYFPLFSLFLRRGKKSCFPSGLITVLKYQRQRKVSKKHSFTSVSSLVIFHLNKE